MGVQQSQAQKSGWPWLVKPFRLAGIAPTSDLIVIEVVEGRRAFNHEGEPVRAMAARAA